MKMWQKVGTGTAVGVGGLLFVLLWVIGILSSLAVPSLAVWALGHFAFHWW